VHGRGAVRFETVGFTAGATELIVNSQVGTLLGLNLQRGLSVLSTAQVALYVEAGARTPLAAVSASVFLVLILFFVAPWARLLQLAVIGGMLLVVAWGLIDRAEIVRLWREEPVERLPLAVTLIGTVTLSLEWAILLGITSALIARRMARPT
jgi:MFS superfamily sulfate permease-like transporter